MEKSKKILSKLRSAVDKYQMIEDGDRIAVGISGGKDSLTLLCALSEMRSFYPKHYELVAVQIDMGFHNLAAHTCEKNEHESIRQLCEQLDVPYVCEETQIAPIIFDYKKEKNPCSLCAKMRRGALHNIAKANGCNKLALGHHFDDAAETLMLNLFFAGRYSSFSPVTYLSRKDITVIRPLIHTEESLIRSFVSANHLPVEISPCPADGNTERAEMKKLLHEFDRNHYYGLYRRLVGSLERSGTDGWKETDGQENIKENTED